jgi:predicted nucleotide-binding protein
MNAAAPMAKLAGIRKAVDAVMNENVSRNRNQGQVVHRSNFEPRLVEHYFEQASEQVNELRKLLPGLFGDFQPIETEPTVKMEIGRPDQKATHFDRHQLERLVRDLDQIFEIRANSELSPPAVPNPRCVFITHGRSDDWLKVQAYIEKDIRLATIELAQRPNKGQTIIEKLEQDGSRCDSAVIVMTGDDLAQDQIRVRENVMHEIGFFHGLIGRHRVILLHEEGVNVPTNLAGIAYVPFPKGMIEAGFHVLMREFASIYTDLD